MTFNRAILIFNALSYICCLSAQTLLTPNPFQQLDQLIINGIDISEFPSNIYVKLGQNKIITATTYSEQTSGFSINDPAFESLIASKYANIKIRDFDLNAIKTWDTRTYNLAHTDKKIKGILTIIVDNDTIIAYGQGNFDGEIYQSVELKFDTSLNLLTDTWRPGLLDINKLNRGELMNRAGNFVTFLSSQFGYICLQESTKDGRIIKRIDTGIPVNLASLGFGKHIVQLPNGYYILNEGIIFNEDFKLIARTKSDRLAFTSNIQVIDSTHYLVAATSLDTTKIDDRPLDLLLVGDINGNLDTVFLQRYSKNFLPNYPVANPGAESIEASDTNAIYFATRRHESRAYFDSNYVFLYCVQKSGKINWSYYFGGKTSVIPLNIIRLPDGGCILTGWLFYEKSSNSIWWKNDILYARFSSNGDLLTTSIDHIQPIKSKGLVYPNPAASSIYFNDIGKFTDLKVVIYNQIGAQLHSEILTNNELKINHLPCGILYYKLMYHDKTIQSGSFIKT
jgi:hypothetical protein